MRAALLRRAGVDVIVEDVELDAPHPGEVLVRVEAAGVCHTELHYIAGEIPCLLPVVLGHEGVGVIEEMGPRITDLAVGERVVFTWRPRCGECEYCVTGRPVMCVYGKVQAASGGLMDGTSRLHQGDQEVHHFLGVSCFAERAVVSRRAVVPVGFDVPARVAAVAGCAVVTGVGAVLNVAAKNAPLAGRPVLIVGAGGVGLSAVMGARLLGAAPLVAVDVSAEKLRLASELGATDLLDVSAMAADDVAEAVGDITHGGAEVAVEAVGSGPTLRQAFAALKPGGMVVAIGLSSAKAEMRVPINELVQQQKQLVGSLYGSSNPAVDLRRLLELYRTGQLPIDRLVGKIYPLDGVARAYSALRGGAIGRAVIEPSLSRA